MGHDAPTLRGVPVLRPAYISKTAYCITAAYNTFPSTPTEATPDAGYKGIACGFTNAAIMRERHVTTAKTNAEQEATSSSPYSL